VKQARLIVAAALLYFTGVATGVVGLRMVVQRRMSGPALPGPWQQLDLIRRTTRGMNLPEAEQVRIDALVRESQRHLRKLWEPLLPVARAEAKYVYQRTIEGLSPDEKQRFEALMAEAMKHRPALTNLWGGVTNDTAAGSPPKP
jgi:hypothetical protein